MEPLGECSRALGGKKDRPWSVFVEGPERLRTRKAIAKSQTF